MFRMTHLLELLQLGRLIDLTAVSSGGMAGSCLMSADACQILRRQPAR
jgi:hypothetical protein